MNKIKRILGPVWMLTGIMVIIYLLRTAIAEISKKPGLETKIQWIVFITVFIPVAAGLIAFGYFALRGEYDEER